MAKNLESVKAAGDAIRCQLQSANYDTTDGRLIHTAIVELAAQVAEFNAFVREEVK